MLFFHNFKYFDIVVQRIHHEKTINNAFGVFTPRNKRTLIVTVHSNCACSATRIRKETAGEYGEWCWNSGMTFYEVQVFSFSEVYKLKYSFIVMLMTNVFNIIQISDYDLTLIWELSLHRILSYENTLFIIWCLSSKCIMESFI